MDNLFGRIGTVVKYLPGKANVIADFLSCNIQNMQHDRNAVSINAFTLESIRYDVPDLVLLQREVINYKSSAGAEKVVLLAAYQAHDQKLIVDEEDNLLKCCFHGGQCIGMPISQREEVLSFSHNQWTSGHFGIFKTHRRVLENFWWPGLHRDVCDFVNNCNFCIRVKHLIRDMVA